MADGRIYGPKCSICDSILWVISPCSRRGWTLPARTQRRNSQLATIKVTDYEAFWFRREQRNKLIRLKTSYAGLWANKLLVIINRARVRRVVSKSSRIAILLEGVWA